MADAEDNPLEVGTSFEVVHRGTFHRHGDRTDVAGDIRLAFRILQGTDGERHVAAVPDKDRVGRDAVGHPCSLDEVADDHPSRVAVDAEDDCAVAWA